MKTIIYKMLYIFLILMSLLGLGCSSAILPPRVVTQYETKVVRIPDILLRTCATTKPPLPNEYIALDYPGKEGVLIDYSIHLLKDIKVCNSQLSEIKKLQDIQLSILKGSASGKAK